MKHLHVISRMPAPGTTSTAGLVVAFLASILTGTAIGPLLTAFAPLKAQQAKYNPTDEVIPDWP